MRGPVMPVTECGDWKNITGTGVVTANTGKLLGFYVNSTSSGTLVLRSGGASGTVMNGTITPAIGFQPYPAKFVSGLHATVGGTIDVTFFFQDLVE